MQRLRGQMVVVLCEDRLPIWHKKLSSNGTCAGFFLEAADWDYTTHELCESKPKVLFSSVPTMHFQPKDIKDFRDFPHYNCPMYKTSARRGVLSTTGHSTNYVMEVRLPSSAAQKHWIKRGTAMLTSLDD